MDFIKDLYLFETQRAADKEVEHTVQIVNKIYNEWKKVTRRTNAVDLVTTSANKLATLNPEAVARCYDATRLKLAVILMRCMDLPPWRSIDTKEKIYKKLYPLIKLLQSVDPNTGTGGNLRDVIATRLSAAISTQDKEQKKTERVFVAYEPKVPAQYIRYLFGEDKPVATYRMMTLSLPADFETFVDNLTLNHEKAKSKFKNGGGVKD